MTSHRRTWFAAALVAGPLTALVVVAWAPGTVAAAPAADRVVVRPADTGAALDNPGMGWVFHHYDNGLGGYGRGLGPGYDGREFPGLTVAYLRLPWSPIEPEEGSFNWSILDTPIERYAAAGKRFALRLTVFESNPREGTPTWVRDAGAKGAEVTADGRANWEPDYDDPVFLAKLEAFLMAAGKRYDGDPRLEFVDVGTLGIWGEGHPIARKYGLATLERHIDLHRRAFPRSLLVAQDDWGYNFRASKDKDGSLAVMQMAAQAGLAFRDDTICVYPDPKTDDNTALAAPFRPHRPIILEMAHYGHTKNKNTWAGGDRYRRAMEAYGAAYLSIHANPVAFLAENRDMIARINRRLGYRIRLVEAAWPATVTRAGGLPIGAVWANAGVAPCLPGGHPTWSLHDAEGRLHAVLVDDDCDVRTLPVGPEDAPPEVRRERSFALPPELPAGTYDLRVAVGSAAGSRRLALPLADGDAARTYKLGTVRVE